jgi:hypothetical protein
MRKSIIITSAFLLITFVVTAQSHYMPGKIVTQNGDTLRGYIDNEQWRSNPQKIKFRKGEEGTPTQTYGISDIRYFSVDGQDAYIRAYVKEDMNPIETEYITAGSKDTTLSDTVFLKVLVLGSRLSLFALTDAKDHYYISSEPDQYDELVYRFYLNQNEQGDTKIDEVDGFRNQLSVYVQGKDSLAMISHLEKLTYAEMPLTKMVVALNGQGQAKVVNNATIKKGIGVYGYGSVGASISSLSFSGMNVGTVGMPFNHPLTPVIEAGVDFQSRQNWGDLGLRLSLAYWSAAFKGQVVHGGETDAYQLTMHVWSPSADVIYAFYRTKHLRLYAGVGISLNECSYPTHNYSVNASYTQYSDTQLIDPEKSWISLHYMVGAKIARHLGVEVEATPTAAITSYTEFSASVSNYAAKVLYYF